MGHRKDRLEEMLQVEQILKLMRERVDHPATTKELLHLLRVPREARATFKRQLRQLVASGDLVEIRGQRYGLPDLMNLVVGRVSTNPRGFAFVEPEDVEADGPKDIFIAGGRHTYEAFLPFCKNFFIRKADIRGKPDLYLPPIFTPKGFLN